MTTEIAKLTLGRRLRLILEFTGTSTREFAEKSGIPYRTLQNYLINDNKPSADHLTKMVENGIDANWLLTGKVSLPIDIFGKINFDNMEKLGADQEFLQRVLNLCVEEADKFNDRYNSKHQKRLGAREILAVVVYYYQRLLAVAGANAKTIKAVRNTFGNNTFIINSLRPHITPDLDLAIEQSALAAARAHKPEPDPEVP